MLQQSFISARRTGLIATCALVVFPTLASAQTYSADQRRLCMGDAFRLCSSAIPNVEEVTICMRKQKASLSSGCKAVFDKPVVTAVSARTTAED